MGANGDLRQMAWRGIKQLAARQLLNTGPLKLHAVNGKRCR